MPRGRDSQPDIVLTDPLRRRRHEARARMALLTRLIADELRALARPACAAEAASARRRPGAAAPGRRRLWIAQAQRQRRAWLAEAQACDARLAARTAPPNPLETKSAPPPPRRRLHRRRTAAPPANPLPPAPPGLC